MSEHIVSLRVYFTIFMSLMVLTALTVAASEVDLGRFNVAVAMAIAVLKASLVVLYFMHLRYSPTMTWLVVGTGIGCLALLILLIMADPWTRDWLRVAPPFPVR